MKKENLKTKKGGKGKGKAEKGGPRTCFECGSEEHIAAGCLVRAIRSEAGGPERLDRPDDPMKGGKSGGTNGYTFIPTTHQWKAAAGTPGVPFPSAKQWSHPLTPGPEKECNGSSPAMAQQ